MSTKLRPGLRARGNARHGAAIRTAERILARAPRTLVLPLALTLTLGAAACESNRTAPDYDNGNPDYRPRNPPPAPQHVPRAIEQGGHVGVRMSNEVSDEEAEKLWKGAEETAPSDVGAPAETDRE